MVDVRLPIVPMSHQYVVTDAFLERREPPLPTLRDPDLLVYFRQEVDGLVMGGYERTAEPWTADRPLVRRHPAGLQRPAAARGLGPLRGDHRTTPRCRVPAMADVGLRKVINGPEAFTPDNEFLLGETDVDGFFVAAGFCAHGIAGAGGIGKVMAEWIVAGDPGMDVWHMDVRRFGRAVPLAVVHPGPHAGDLRDLLRHRLPRPGAGGRAAAADQPGVRLARRARGVVRREVRLGAGQPLRVQRVRAVTSRARPRGWAGRLWSPAIGVEHAATREAVALFDESSFAKLMVTGPDAAALLQWVCDNDVARGVGDVTYTQALNAAGRHRVGLHRDPAGRRRVPGRHRDGVRRRTTRPGCGGRPVGATPPCGSTTSRASS